MTVDAFLAWAETREGRFELLRGRVVAMAPERARHVRVKLNIAIALRSAIERAGLDCEAFGDGMTVRIDEGTAFEPDALVQCGARVGGDAVEVSKPLIVVEVISPASGGIDTGVKLAAYFRIDDLAHYLVLDPVSRVAIRHSRGPHGTITSHIHREGDIPLEPPGITLALAELFVDAD